MKYILISAVSKDGYIARYPGDLPNKWTSTEEQNIFKKDIKSCFWSVMGRNTHELSFNLNRKRIIFTNSVNKYKTINKNHIYFNPQKESLKSLLNIIKPKHNLCILGGTKVNDYFLKKKIIDEFIITEEPIEFKSGLKLFSKLKWNDLLNNHIKFGLLKKQKIINQRGTIYFHFLKK